MIHSTRRELLEQVASWYYEDNQTQEAIAEQIDVSRSTVSRLLQEARDEGLVEIRVKRLVNTDTRLEDQLVRTFGLAQASVLAESPAEHETLIQRIGELSARFLRQQLHDHIRIGIGWGMAVYETTNCLPEMPLRDAMVIQLIGAIGQGSSTVDGPECARQLALKFGATVRFIHAPALVESEAVAQALAQEPTIAAILTMIHEVEVALTGIGTVEPVLSSLHRAGFLGLSDLAALKEAGVVGDVLGYQFDALGRVLDISLNRRIIAANLGVLRKIPIVIGVAGGIAKAPAILAALRGKYITVLITDERTASEVLRLHAKPVERDGQPTPGDQGTQEVSGVPNP
jgi:deoxyribonucleoside regulator